MRVHNVKSCWRILTNKLPTNNIPDIFDERHICKLTAQGSSDTVILQNKLASSSRHVVGLCPAEMWNVQFPEGVALKPP